MGSQSPFFPYFEFMPDTFKGFPIQIPEEIIDTWLEGTELLYKIKLQKMNIETEYSYICAGIPEFSEKVSLEFFFKSNLMVLSRHC